MDGVLKGVCVIAAEEHRIKVGGMQYDLKEQIKYDMLNDK